MRIPKTLQQRNVQLLIIAVFIITMILASNKQHIHVYTVVSSMQPVPRLTRIGSELDFNYSSCPPSSVMLNSTQLNAPPLHDNCPHVFIIGARKGGTTAMYQYLSQHPDFGGIRLNNGAASGETFYFNNHYYRISWKDYVSEFPTDKLSGESTVGYLLYCPVPLRLYSNCGRTTKVVVLLRDPLERFQSSFRLSVRSPSHKNYNNQSHISDDVDKQIERFYLKVAASRGMDYLSNHPNEIACLRHDPSDRNMVYAGLYYVHLHHWLCNFPAENIIILNTEQFRENSVKSLAEVMEFVGLRPLDDHKMQQMTSVLHNYGGRLEDEPSFRKLTVSDRKKLIPIYEPFNKKLFQLLKWNNVKWNKIPE